MAYVREKNVTRGIEQLERSIAKDCTVNGERAPDDSITRFHTQCAFPRRNVLASVICQLIC